MYEAVIFDWDGTLADTRKVILVSFQKALSEVDCSVSDEFIERRIGIGASETFREILRQSNRAFDEKVIANLVKRKVELEVELTPQVPLFDGTRELLDNLLGKIKIGLASMNNREVIMHMLRFNGLQKYFPVVLTAESITHSKPNPEIFLKCASNMQAAPEKCVVVEDSIFGVKAAKSGGMGCIAVLTGVYSRSELEVAKPDLIVESLCDKRALGRILSI
jgi:beta-phosphoglucomutase